MDIEDTIEVFCAAGKGLHKSSVQAEWLEEYCMKCHPTLHDCIEKEWVKKLEECAKLFNASKFRLHGIKMCNRLNPMSSQVKLLVGTTCYKDFIGTNCASYGDLLVQDGLCQHSNPQIFLSDPIGVGALLMSEDNYLIFIRRSHQCAEMQGMLDRPGGHPEPNDIISGDSYDLKDLDPSLIVEEIFGSVLKEIRDEVNIPICNLSSPLLLGIGYNPKTRRRPSLEFYVRCSLTGKEVLKMYQTQTQAESEESTELLMIPVQDILENDLKTLAFYEELTHPAKSALFFLKIFLS